VKARILVFVLQAFTLSTIHFAEAQQLQKFPESVMYSQALVLGVNSKHSGKGCGTRLH
jgi:hypothetical protein